MLKSYKHVCKLVLQDTDKIEEEALTFAGRPLIKEMAHKVWCDEKIPSLYGIEDHK